MKGKVELTLQGIGTVVAGLPIMLVVGLFLYVLRVRLRVGYWPYPYQPESWSIGFDVHYQLLRPWFYTISMDFVVLGVTMYGFCLWVAFRHFPKSVFITLGIACLMYYPYVLIDPGHFIEWFYD